MFRGHVSKPWNLQLSGFTVSNQLDSHAIGIRESEYRFAHAPFGALDLNVRRRKSLLPVVNRGGRNAERGLTDLACSNRTPRSVRPGKEGHDGTGRSCVISEVEMVGPGIVEVDGFFDEAKSKDDRIEVEVTLRVTGNCG